MTKTEIKYGIIDTPVGTPLCSMEKGGDKDGKARYRFVDTGKKIDKRIIALVTTETVMRDLYGAPWAHTPQGWVKAEDKITWYSSYKEASNMLASLTNRKQKIVITILLLIAFAGIGYIIYKTYKSKINTPIVDTTINIDLDNEITE
jgi:hypothetical protein